MLLSGLKKCFGGQDTAVCYGEGVLNQIDNFQRSEADARSGLVWKDARAKIGSIDLKDFLSPND